MLIEIGRYAFHQNRVIELSDGKITLVKGKSGSGKSTLLEAIYWALYGDMPSGKKDDVKVFYRNILIHRTSKPSTLTFTDEEGKDYTGDQAQERIDKIFGAKDLFRLCCFTTAGDTPIPLFSSNNNVKLYYLTKLAFKDRDDPILLINKIRERMTAEKKEFKAQFASYEEECETYNKRLEDKPFPKECSKYSLEDLQKRISAHEKTILSLREKKWRNDTMKESERNLVLSLEKKEKALKKIQENIDGKDPQDTSDLEKEINTLKESKDALDKERETLRTDIDRIRNSISLWHLSIETMKKWEEKCKIREQITLKDLPKKYDHSDFFQLQSLHKTYEEAQKACKEIDVKYSKKALKELMAEVDFVIEYEKKKERHLLYTKIKEEYDAIQENSSTLESLENTFYEMKQGLDILSCPSCGTSLRHKGSSLVVETRSPVTKEMVKKHESHIKEVKTHLTKKESLFMRMNEFTKEERKNSYKDTYDVKEAIKIKEKIKRIQIIEPPSLSIEEGKRLLDYFSIKINSPPKVPQEPLSDLETEWENKKKRLDIIQEEWKTIRKIISNKKNDLSLIKENNERINILKKDYVALSREIEDIKKNIENISIESDVEESLSEEEKSLLKYQTIYNSYEFYQEMCAIDVKLQEKEKTLEEKKEEVRSIVSLYHNAVSEHYAHLHTVVNTINKLIAQEISHVFSYPMTIRFSLQTINQKKEYCNTVTLDIVRRGETAKFGKKMKICSGEKERTALLAITALNSIYRLPFILMDELMARLDAEIREECIQVLRSNMRGRTILCAEHHVEDGDYDDVIEFKLKDLNA